MYVLRLPVHIDRYPPPLMTGRTISDVLMSIEHLKRVVEAESFQRFIVVIILINAVTLGLETSETAMARAGAALYVIDRIILGIFVAELAAKLVVYRRRFFASGWNLFDLAVIGVSVIPATGNFSILRALRILRVLRLLSVMPQLRRVIEALMHAMPGMGSIGLVLALIYYVSAVLATKLFAASFPDWFGSIGASMYTLFQLMTLESWSMGIVRPVMEVYPWSWLFFVPFIIVTSFAVLNLVIAIIVNSMQTLQEDQTKAEKAMIHEEAMTVAGEVAALRTELAEIRALLEKEPPRPRND